MTDIQQVKNAFYVSGSEVILTYYRNLTTNLVDVPIVVSSSATNFHIRVYPTSSIGVEFRLSGSGRLVNSNAPITLPPKSGSTSTTTTLLASINTQNFNTLSVTSKKFDIQFNLVAMTDRILTGSSDNNDNSDDQSTTKKQMGEVCNVNSECYSGYCYNINNRADGGVCANPPELLDNGAVCTQNSDCKSNYCDNPNNQTSGGICKSESTETSSPPPPPPPGTEA